MEAPMKRFLTSLLVAIAIAAPTLALADAATTPGANLVELALSDRLWRGYDAGIISNGTNGIAAGAMDSSIMRPLKGAGCMTLRIWPVVSDSAGAVVKQWLFLQMRYGEGLTNDSTGALPLVRLRAPADRDTFSIDPGGISPAGFLYEPLVGEIAIGIPPYTKISQKYFEVELPAPPPGAVTYSLRARVGATYLKNGNAAGAWAKGNMKLRIDARRGRCANR
jgi:hypothetical protein